MSLSDWLANRWIVTHTTTVEEIESLFAVVDRDLDDATVPRLSSDWHRHPALIPLDLKG